MPVFDASKVEVTDTPSTPLPDGWHVCYCDEASTSLTQRHDKRLKLKFKVDTGPHAGRIIFDNHMLTYSGESQRCVEISQQRLKKLCDAIGLPVVNDWSDLIGKTVVVQTRIGKPNQYGKCYPEVRDFMSEKEYGLGRAAAPAAAPAQPTSPGYLPDSADPTPF